MEAPRKTDVPQDDRTTMLDAEMTIRLGAAPVPGTVTGASRRNIWHRPRALPPDADRKCVPGCTLEAVLGRGGMGAVYLGRQDRLERQVAVKVLNSDLANNPEFIGRLRQEARILGAMAHPNVVGCHDIIVSKNGASLVMEYIPGQLNGRNVVQLLGPMPERYAVQVLLGVAHALSYAYEKGYTHRDVKPENILLAFDSRRPPANYDELFHYPDFRVALCDFGIAVANTHLERSVSRAHEDSQPIMGSPLYMAPEQAAMPEKLNFRADIYSLGCTGYYLLCGAAPFNGKDWNAILDQKVEKNLPAPPAPAGKHFSPELLRILAKMGRVLPEERYADYPSLLKELTHLDEVFAERDRSIRTFLYAHQRSLSLLCGVVLVLLLGAFTGVTYYTHWLQNYSKRQNPQLTNPFRWSGEHDGWLQRVDNVSGGLMLVGVRNASRITMEKTLHSGDFLQMQLGCGEGEVNMRLKKGEETVGFITLRHVREENGQLRYHIIMSSLNSDMLDGVASQVPMPKHFQDEAGQWVELRIELYDKFYCLWNHGQLLGVGHFDTTEYSSGYQLEIGPVRTSQVTFRRILLVEEKVARHLRKL